MLRWGSETDGQSENGKTILLVILNHARESLLLPENVYFVHKLFIKITTSISILSIVETVYVQNLYFKQLI